MNRNEFFNVAYETIKATFLANRFNAQLRFVRATATSGLTKIHMTMGQYSVHAELIMDTYLHPSKTEEQAINNMVLDSCNIYKESFLWPAWRKNIRWCLLDPMRHAALLENKYTQKWYGQTKALVVDQDLNGTRLYMFLELTQFNSMGYSSLEEAICAADRNMLDKAWHLSAVKELLAEQNPMVNFGVDAWHLTSYDNFLGAGVMAVPQVLLGVSKVVGSEFYVLPTSIHDVVILGKTDIPLRLMTKIITDVNAHNPEADTVLGDYVYRFSAGDMELVANGDALKEQEETRQWRK